MLRRVHVSLKLLAAGLTAFVLAIALSSCAVSGVEDPAVIHVTAFYFQQYYVPGATSTPLVCMTAPSPTDQHWYVFVEVTGIDNSSTGVSSFSFNADNFIAKNSSVTKLGYSFPSYLYSWWNFQTVTVGQGQSLGISQVHQGAFFLIDFGSTTTASDLSATPPVLYQGGIISPNPSQNELASPTVWSLPSQSAQPTNSGLANAETVPLVEAGPCS